MKYVKMLGLLAVAAAALMAFAGTASADTLTSPANSAPWTGTIEASAGTTQLHGEAFNTHCTGSTVKGTVTEHGTGKSVKGNVSTLDFTGCSPTVTPTVAGGTLSVDGISPTGNGTLTSNGAKITIHGAFGISCTFTTKNTHIGEVTGSNNTGGKAVLHIKSALIPRTEGSGLCGEFGEWTGSYTVNSPTYLAVHDN